MHQICRIPDGQILLVSLSPCLFQLRLCLKSYSFLRENCYKVLYPWNKDDDSGPAVLYAGQLEPKTSSFSQYLYFIFCPSLIYRDRYPRFAVVM